MDITVGAISYENLGDNMKLSKRSAEYFYDTAKELYAALLSSGGNVDGEDCQIQEILELPNGEEDKEKLMSFVEQLSVMGKDIGTICNSLTVYDLRTIKDSNDKVKNLQEIIEDRLGFSDDQKTNIQNYIDRQSKLFVQKSEKDEIEEAALRYWSTNRISHIGSKMKSTLKKYEDIGGYTNKDCYMTILRQGSYIHNNLGGRVGRYILPWKFNWRNISRQTKKTIEELTKRKNNSSSALEKRAIDLVMEYLKNAYSVYKREYDRKKGFLLESDFSL